MSQQEGGGFHLEAFPAGLCMHYLFAGSTDWQLFMFCGGDLLLVDPFALPGDKLCRVCPECNCIYPRTSGLNSRTSRIPTAGLVVIKNKRCATLAYKMLLEGDPDFSAFHRGLKATSQVDTENENIAAGFHSSFVSAPQDSSCLEVFTSFPSENHQVQEDAEQGPSAHKGQVQPSMKDDKKKFKH